MKFNQILYGHVLEQIPLIPDNSIDCVFTSPPYWSKRDYGLPNVVWGGSSNCDHNFVFEKKKIRMTKGNWKQGDEIQKDEDVHEYSTRSDGVCSKCNAWFGQFGLEPTINRFINHLVLVFEALRPKIKEWGSLWVNLGDGYYGGGLAGGHTETTENLGVKTEGRGYLKQNRAKGKLNNIPDRSLILIPYRFAITMIDNGWILRNNIVWEKSNAMPESAKNRYTTNFEPIFFFTKKPKYYFKQQLEPFTEESAKRFKYGFNIQPRGWAEGNTPISGGKTPNFSPAGKDGDILMKNMRAVWKIPTKSFSGAHFAVFPERLSEIVIDSSCPEKVCVECDTPDLISCDCNADFRPGNILDPFMGAGTVGTVAKRMKRDWLGIELNKDYINEIAIPRINKQAAYHSLDDWL